MLNSLGSQNSGLPLLLDRNGLIYCINFPLKLLFSLFFVPILSIFSLVLPAITMEFNTCILTLIFFTSLEAAHLVTVLLLPDISYLLFELLNLDLELSTAKSVHLSLPIREGILLR
jgi:hypothetical protein